MTNGTRAKEYFDVPNHLSMATVYPVHINVDGIEGPDCWVVVCANMNTIATCETMEQAMGLAKLHNAAVHERITGSVSRRYVE